MQAHPILYSFRRCPYAMRARIATYVSGITVELREVQLKNKPQSMLDASSKGTVPTLILNDETVLDESIDIMQWAFEKALQKHWLSNELLATKKQHEQLINQNDTEFKYYLDRYKYFDHHPEHSQDYYLKKALPFLKLLEENLAENCYLQGSKFGFTDAAIAPFIRQFFMTDQQRFKQLNLPKLEVWLSKFLKSDLFQNIMKKYTAWQQGQEIILLDGL